MRVRVIRVWVVRNRPGSATQGLAVSFSGFQTISNILRFSKINAFKSSSDSMVWDESWADRDYEKLCK